MARWPPNSRKVEAHMAEGGLRGGGDILLDLGIDWADIDLVVQVGAPKERRGCCNGSVVPAIGMIWISRAVLVPANRFESLNVRLRLLIHVRPA